MTTVKIAPDAGLPVAAKAVTICVVALALGGAGWRERERIERDGE